MSLTDKQKAAREKALGSSDAATVAGVNPYKGIVELFYQLVGQLPRYDENETWEQKVGSKVEPIIAELVAEELGIKIRRAAPAVHPRYPFMTCNLDFEIVSHPNGPGILEIKRRSCQPFSELPDDMTIQVVHQMAVKRREWAKVAVQFLWGKPVVFEVQRDKEIEEYLIELEARFMALIQKGEPPDETWTPNTVGLLKKLYPQDSGKVIQLDVEARLMAENLLITKQHLEIEEEHKARYTGWLQSRMQDASTAKIPGFGEITWKSTRSTKTLDVDRLKAEHTDLVQQYMVDRPGYRRFQVKPFKEVSCLPKKSPSETISLPEPDLPTPDPPSA